MIRCWPVIHRVVRHHAYRPIRRGLRHAVRHKAATITIVCVTVGTPLPWMLPQGGFNGPNGPVSVISGVPRGPILLDTGASTPLIFPGAGAMPSTIEQSARMFDVGGTVGSIPATGATPVNVPEPGTLVLFATGLALLGLVRRKLNA